MKPSIKLLFLAAFSLFFSQIIKAGDPLPLNHIDHPYQRIEQLLNAAPSGTSLDKSQFEAAMGPDVAEYLRLFGIDHIDSAQDTITLSLAQQYNGRTKAGTKIQMDKAVTFVFHPDASGVMLCDQLTGVRVKPFMLFGWMSLKQIKISLDTAGNTDISVQVQTLFTVSYTVKVRPDGTVVK